MSRSLLAALVFSLVGCTPDRISAQDDTVQTVFGGGEVTVGFETTTGAGWNGAFTVPGSDPSSIRERGLFESTGLYVHHIEDQEPGFTLAIHPGDVRIDAPAGTVPCEAQWNALSLVYTWSDFADVYRDDRIHIAYDNGYTLSSHPDWYPSEPRLQGASGSFTYQVEFHASPTCGGPDTPDLSDTMQVTLEWDFDVSYRPDTENPGFPHGVDVP